MGDIEEYPFSFINTSTPACLQLLASSGVALMLWQCKYYLNGIPLRLFMKLQEPRFSCDEMLVIPSRFKAEIDKKIITIHKELRIWLNDGDYRYDLSTCFKHIVINASGRIDYKATAVNILNSGDLSDDLMSYRMACRFCLEDQIKRIWPSVAEVNKRLRLDEITDPIEFDLVFYWTGRYVRSNEDSIHTDCRVLSVIDNTPPNRPALEYFWKMLPVEQRISTVISSLKKGDYSATKVLLPTLNRIHAEKVFQVATAEVVRFLVSSNDDYLPHVYQLWTAMKHTTVLEKKSSFSAIVRGLWPLADSRCIGWRLSYARCDQINDALLQIWSSAEDELKDYVSNSDNIVYFFNRLDAGSANIFCCYGHDAIFLLDLLERSRDLDKEQFWRHYWRRLALLVKPSCLERLMRLCLPNDDDAIEVFKSQLLDFTNLFESLIKEGFYSHLRDYLLFCSKDAIQFQRLSKDILESNLDAILLHDDDKFAEFDRFVSELFLNVEKDADEFKVQIISSAEGLKCLLSTRLADGSGTRLSDFGRIISRFTRNERQLHLVKNKLWATWKMDTAYVDQLNADQWRSFLEWCAVDSEELTAFKSSLNLDRIFVTRLTQYFNGEADEVLEFLDTFLKWYYTNEEDVKNFKLDVIKNYKRIDVFCAKLESNNERDRRLMNELFRWFLRW
ncbi:uncharacterized protein LOC135837563 [Planococcus citri]|uniref:uncharacterized protein LOC135837563 n=1 Tax=Planococcus citri TaxID=170843 RepID=UPI0031FA3CB2